MTNLSFIDSFKADQQRRRMGKKLLNSNLENLYHSFSSRMSCFHFFFNGHPESDRKGTRLFQLVVLALENK